MVAVGRAHNKLSAHAALRWVTQQGIVAVAASITESHLASDLASLDFSLSEGKMELLARI